MSFENDESLATELELFTENDGDLYHRMTEPILKNLATKKAQGKYDSEKAVQAFMYLAEEGAKEYIRQHGSPTDVWHEMFPINVRRMAATKWRDEFEEEFKLGNYDHLVPKKYQGRDLNKPPTCPVCKGTGSRKITTDARGRKLPKDERHSTRCPRCGGAGTLS